MNNHSIDDLLKVVSPGLIVGYEKHNNVKLSDTNEEYRKVSHEDPYVVVIRYMKVLSALGLISLAASLVINIHYKHPYIGLVAMVVPMLSFMGYFHFVAGKKVIKQRKTIANCEPVLEDFRAAVKGLDPINRNREYTEVIARGELVGCAVRILDAEMKFDASRLQKDRRTSVVLQYGNWLEKCQNTFETTLKSAQQFGMEFVVSDLFADAQEHIEQTNQLLSKSAIAKSS